MSGDIELLPGPLCDLVTNDGQNEAVWFDPPETNLNKIKVSALVDQLC